MTHSSLPPDQLQSKHDKTIVSFDDMDLSSELLHDVYKYGFENPSAVQQRAIVPVIQGESKMTLASPIRID